MPAILNLLLHLLLLLRLSSAVSHHQNPPQSPQPPPSLIAEACKATRFQPLCVTTLYHHTSLHPLPPSPTPLDAVLSSLSLSSSAVRSSLPVVESLLRSSAGDLNLTSHSKNCLNAHLPLSLHRLSLASSALSSPPAESLVDARVYVGAALQYVYDCWSELSYSNTSSRVDRAMAFLDSVFRITSNSLSMISSYDVYGPDPRSWRAPLTERAGFWEPVRVHGPKSPSNQASTNSGLGPGLGRTLVIPTGATADATVCNGGRRVGCYGTVQEAVNAAPNWHGSGSGKNEKGQRFVIRIKAGVYEEVVRVPLEKRNVVFLGDGIGKTVITGDLSVARPGMFTYNTAIVGKLRASPLFLSDS